MKGTAIWQIEKAVSGELICGDRNDIVHGVSTDSREISGGDVFFALVGENHDAHDFIADAVSNGAKSIVVSEESAAPLGAGLNVIKAADTTKALQDLARWYVSELNVKKIGITGSTGKTTTKDLLYYICREKYKTARNTGNLNNHIGLPLTVLSFDEDIEVGVLEMGTECLGEINLLAGIAKPDIAIITNIGISHIETFGSRENILKGKMEITDFFTEDNLLVVNEENDLLTKSNVSGRYRLATVGSSGKSSFILTDIRDFGEDGIEFSLEHMELSHRFKLGVPGRHNAVNASLAIAAAMDLGISMEEAARGLANAVLTEKRLSIKGRDGIKVIDDTYNASPDSMRAALDVLAATKGMRKVAVLGDMFGLGDMSCSCHEQIGEYVGQKGVDLLVLTGEFSKHTAEKANETMGSGAVLHYSSRDGLEAEIKTLVRPGDVVLVKGSRAMAMESVVRKILE
ncbi:MAG: UDP-N-acetylmuramoyl-tripeptide--D-alanyl-D-alanine ligase [Clostridiales bacterium]|nr:UDP-N-acetylmuramoyl-tripeptide--D-alanyl-D-alanine ligase [Clostridiales bacterium]